MNDQPNLNARLRRIDEQQQVLANAGKHPNGTATASSALVVQQKGVAPFQPLTVDPAADTPSPGVIGSFLLGAHRVRGNIRREKAIRDAHLVLLDDKIKAAKLESTAYWCAKSAELAEHMNTYLQEHLLIMESTRMDNRVKALELAAATVTARLRTIDAADYPDVIKDGLLADAYHEYRRTCERIQNEVLVEKYISRK